jgi:hypothetical protein
MTTRKASRAASFAFVVAIAAAILPAGATAFLYRADRARASGGQLTTVAAGRYIGVTSSNLYGFDTSTGIRANITVRYLAWGTQLPTDYIASTYARGATTMIELLPYTISLKSIVAGGGDEYLKELGSEMAGVHEKISVAFAPEANSSTYKGWGYKRKGVTPALYIAAWRHVHDVLADSGGNRVTWVWQETHSYPGTIDPITRLWPGNAYVDMVGLDGYYYKRTDNFTNIFSTGIEQVRKITKKPIIISEIGIGPLEPNYGAGQARSMPDFFAGLSKYHVAGFVYFDHRQTDPPIHQDWYLRPGTSGMRAFKRDATAFAKG